MALVFLAVPRKGCGVDPSASHVSCTESRESLLPQALTGIAVGRWRRGDVTPCSSKALLRGAASLETPEWNANDLSKRNQQFLIHATTWDGNFYIAIFFHSVRVYWKKSTAGLSESSDTLCRKLAPKVYFTMFKFVMIHTAEVYFFPPNFCQIALLC